MPFSPGFLRAGSVVATTAITRGRLLSWLRVGMFGVTGFLMNHRSVLKIPVEKAETTKTRVSIPTAFDNPGELTLWLRGRYGLPEARAQVRTEARTLVGLAEHDEDFSERQTRAR